MRRLGCSREGGHAAGEAHPKALGCYSRCTHAAAGCFFLQAALTRQCMSQSRQCFCTSLGCMGGTQIVLQGTSRCHTSIAPCAHTPSATHSSRRKADGGPPHLQQSTFQQSNLRRKCLNPRSAQICPRCMLHSWYPPQRMCLQEQSKPGRPLGNAWMPGSTRLCICKNVYAF